MTDTTALEKTAGALENEEASPAQPAGSLSRRAFVAAGAAATGAAWSLMGPVGAATAAVTKAPKMPAPGVRAAGRSSKPGAGGVLPAPKPIYRRHSDPADLGVLEAASLLQAGLLSSREITSACQARIAARNGPVSFDGSPTAINAWIRLYPELAAELSRAADARLASGRRKGEPAPLLCGVPLALKDLYAVKGVPLTAGSHVLDGNVASGDSTVWSRLKAAGMVLLGHAHAHEFALGYMTPQSGNPWNLAKSPGGSSGGSGAALAARMVPAATGTDTGGSLRSPASANGVSSIKPTFGLVSTHGVIPIGWSVDHAGPMARGAGDLGLLLAAMAGPDPADPASLTGPPAPAVYPTLPRAGNKPLRDVRIGVPKGADEGMPSALSSLFARAQAELRSLGATIVPFVAPDESSISAEMTQAVIVEGGTYHQQFAPARSASYGPSVGPAIGFLISAATSTNAATYIDGQRHRLAYIHQWNAAFTSHRLDGVLKPGTGVDGVSRLGAAASVPGGGVTGDYPWANFAGLPVVTLPVGLSSATGMPFGVQLGGAPRTEAELLQIAIDYQAHYRYGEAIPPRLS